MSGPAAAAAAGPASRGRRSPQPPVSPSERPAAGRRARPRSRPRSAAILRSGSRRIPHAKPPAESNRAIGSSQLRSEAALRPRLSHPGQRIDLRPRQTQGHTQRLRPRCDHQSRLPVPHELQRSARVLRRQDGLAREKGLQRDVAEVFAGGGHRHDSRVRIQREQRLLVRRSIQRTRPSTPSSSSASLEPLPLGALTHEHARARGRVWQGLEQEARALPGVQPAHPEHRRRRAGRFGTGRPEAADGRAARRGCR